MTRSHRPGVRGILPLALAMAVGVLSLTGCQEPVEEFNPPARKEAAFEGETPESLVGKWETDNKNSKMNLSSDGKAEMENTAVGRGTSKVSGEWKATKEHLLIKAGDSVSRYEMELKGDTLRLKMKSVKLDVTYKKVK